MHVKIAPKVMGVTVRQCSPGKDRCVAIDPWGDRMSNIELETSGFLNQFWPAVLVPVGLGPTVAWVCFLAYGLIELALLAIRIAA